jgi:hypothetical protein
MVLRIRLRTSTGEQSFWKDTSGGDTTCAASDIGEWMKYA